MEYFDIVKDKIYHKRTDKLVLNLREVDYFSEGTNGFLLVRTVGSYYDNLAIDSRGCVLPHTGEDGICVCLLDDKYIIKRFSNPDDKNVFCVDTYHYPYRETEGFVFLYNEKEGMYSIYTQDGYFIIKSPSYRLMQYNGSEYVQIKQGDDRIMYDVLGGIVSDDTGMNFMPKSIGLSQFGYFNQLNAQSRQNKKKMYKFFTTCCALATCLGVGGYCLLKIEAEDRMFDNQKASFIKSDRSNTGQIFFDTDCDLSTIELVGEVSFSEYEKSLISLRNNENNRMSISAWKKLDGLKNMRVKSYKESSIEKY